MSDFTVSLDFSRAFSVLEACPRCQSQELSVTADGELTVFRCQSCQARWLLQLGQVWQVGDPAEGDLRPDLTGDQGLAARS